MPVSANAAGCAVARSGLMLESGSRKCSIAADARRRIEQAHRDAAAERVRHDHVVGAVDTANSPMPTMIAARRRRRRHGADPDRRRGLLIDRPRR